MKRPLGIAALVLAAAAAVFLQVRPAEELLYARTGDGGSFPLEEGERYLVAGEVYRAEKRSSGGREQLWLYLRAATVRGASGGPEAALSANLICKTEDCPRPKLGSKVTLKGQFSYFPRARNPGEFDSFQYYHILKIGGSLKKAELLREGREYSAFREGLYRLQCFWEERLYACFPEREASILCTMLLGNRTGLDSEIKELYQRNGIVHILSISGLHITLIGMGLYRLLRKAGCPVCPAALSGGILLLSYGVMTGMGVSACRAIGMYLIRMLGEILGRTYDMLTALGIMGILMLVQQPEYLRHSGFLLSFGSIGGIGILLPALQPPKALTEKAAVHIAAAFWKALAPGAAITLFTLPVHLWFYYEIPVYSIFLNLCVLPAMGLVMGLGLFVMLLPGMGWMAWADCLILGGYERLCRLFDLLPGHTWTPGCPAPWQAAVYYLLLALFLLWKGKSRKTAFLRILLPAAAVWVIAVRFHAPLEATFLDVGQGDAICVRTGEGEVYLFDAGSSSERSIARYKLIPFLKHEGITHIDAIFLSHPDADHYSGIVELLQEGKESGVTIERLFLPDLSPDRRKEDLKPVLEAVKNTDQELRLAYLSKGDEWSSGETVFTCLHPEPGAELEDVNACSLCFLIRRRSFSMLLTGDVQGTGEQQLMEALEALAPVPVTLLKVAHHGSRNSTPEELLELISPRVAVISCGEDNSYGHPHPELLERLDQSGCRIHITAREGAVSVCVRDRATVRTALSG